MAAKKSNPEDIFHCAIEITDASERAAYLDRACQGDETLRAEVDLLLASHEEVGDFLETPPVEADVTLEAPPLLEIPGTTVGRYTLLEKIGEGGMAVVYMAEQKRPIRRKVAFKIIKLGMDTKQVIARFEAERQALAMMDHPNVAHVYDAGTTETGRSYFVMELVRGVSLTEYCDKNKLGTHQRLELFIPVCHAVQHAHHKGLIHRDLKPSNIMVTLHDGKPVPKVIDFGVAKATNQELTERTLFTRYAQMIGTPEYMSPEQAEMSGLDIDTRSDVYSLGVVLYELLTGVHPIDPDSMASAALGEIRRIIQEEEPLRPSSKLSSLGEDATRVAQTHRTEVKTLVKCLHQELEWIPLKAMRKDRTRRYQSVLELADDIQNYLDGAPLSAGPESVVYRAKKFVRRNRAFVTGIAAVLAILVAGVVVSTLFAIKAEHARAEAEAVSNFLRKDVLASMNPFESVSPFATRGQEVTVRSVLDTASERLEGKFRDKPLVEASIRQTLGNTYRDLGLHDQAEAHLKRALELYQTQLGSEDPAALTCMTALGRVHFFQARYREAETLLIDVIEGMERVLGREHPGTLLSTVSLGWVYNMQGRLDEAEPLFVRGLETSRRVFGEEDPNTAYFTWGLGFAHEGRGNYEEAERLYTEVWKLRGRTLGEEHLRTLEMEFLLGALYSYRLGRYDKAEPLLERVLEVTDRILGPDHPATLAAKGALGFLYAEQGRYAQAESLVAGTLTTARQAGDGFHAGIWWCVHCLGRLYFLQGQYDKAHELLVPMLGVARQKGGEENPVITLPFKNLVGQLYTAQGDYEKAEKLFKETLDACIRVLGEEHPETLNSLSGLAVLRSKQAQYDQAERLFSQALKGRQDKFGTDNPRTLESLHDFGVMYLEQGRHEDAETKLLAAYKGRKSKLGPEHPMTLKSLNKIIQLYESWERPDEAEKWRAKLLGKEDTGPSAERNDESDVESK